MNEKRYSVISINENYDKKQRLIGVNYTDDCYFDTLKEAEAYMTENKTSNMYAIVDYTQNWASQDVGKIVKIRNPE